MTQTTRRIVTGGLVAALAVLLVLTANSPKLVSAQTVPTPTANTITVTGQGQAAGQPDLANVQLGVSVTNVDPGKALSQASDAIDAITKAVIAAGVAQNDIQTNGLNLYSQNPPQPQASTSGSDTAQVSYQAQVNLSVRVRGDVTKAGTVIDAAVKAGANNIYGVSYSIADPGKLETTARQQAVSDAKDRAQQLATALGLKLGSPISSVEEPSSSGPVPLANAMLASGGGGVPISAGQLSVSIQETVTFSVSQ